MSSQSSTTPQAARLVLRVGVTGHRAEGLEKLGVDQERLRRRIRQVLARLCVLTARIHQEGEWVYAPEDPLLRLTSHLAEGADRLVAEEALELNYELQCLLPFPRDEYEKDFKIPGSKEFFRKILGLATQVLERDGNPDRRSEAYLAAGKVLLLQCDLLLAIWDGAPAHGEGGTGDVIEEAIRLKIPILCIDARSPHRVYFWYSGDRADGAPKRGALKELRQRLRATLLLSKDETVRASPVTRLLQFLLPPPTAEPKRVRRFLREKPPIWNYGVLFLIFEYFWTGEWAKLKKLRIRKPPHLHRTPLQWANDLAEFYAGLYRSSFILAYIMGAWAVLVAFLGIIFDKYARLWFGIELVIILFILLVTLVGRGKGWHERWLDYRLLAEALRQMDFLSGIGRLPASFKVPVHLEPGDSQRSWAIRHFHALVRQSTLVGGRMTRESLVTYQEKVLLPAIAKQVKYHHDNHKRFELLHRWPHLMAQLLFGLAGIACLLHVLVDWRRPFELFLFFCAIVLPAFSGALAAILHHGEFERLALRSRSLWARLKELQQEAATSGLDPIQLSRIAGDLSDVMMSELVDWRFVFLEKNLVLPA
jgi:hypothetical protein